MEVSLLLLTLFVGSLAPETDLAAGIADFIARGPEGGGLEVGGTGAWGGVHR